eukprot:2798646-Prymnesium_polylepis.2
MDFPRQEAISHGFTTSSRSRSHIMMGFPGQEAISHVGVVQRTPKSAAIMAVGPLKGREAHVSRRLQPHVRRPRDKFSAWRPPIFKH